MLTSTPAAQQHELGPYMVSALWADFPGQRCPSLTVSGNDFLEQTNLTTWFGAHNTGTKPHCTLFEHNTSFTLHKQASHKHSRAGACRCQPFECPCKRTSAGWYSVATYYHTPCISLDTTRDGLLARTGGSWRSQSWCVVCRDDTAAVWNFTRQERHRWHGKLASGCRSCLFSNNRTMQPHTTSQRVHFQDRWKGI